MSAMIEFVHWTTLATHPYHLCRDLREKIFQLVDNKKCNRCMRTVIEKKRIAVCFRGDERLCFECCHRALWPRLS